jgi:hypothetical protein
VVSGHGWGVRVVLVVSMVVMVVLVTVAVAILPELTRPSAHHTPACLYTAFSPLHLCFRSLTGGAQRAAHPLDIH